MVSRKTITSSYPPDTPTGNKFLDFINRGINGLKSNPYSYKYYHWRDLISEQLQLKKIPLMSAFLYTFTENSLAYNCVSFRFSLWKQLSDVYPSIMVTICSILFHLLFTDDVFKMLSVLQKVNFPLTITVKNLPEMVISKQMGMRGAERKYLGYEHC